MNPNPNPMAKAHMNGTKRPFKTSPLNPYVMRRRPEYGEVRISPRIAALKATGMSHAQAIQAAESKANYQPGYARGWDTRDSRSTVAHMLRRYRKTGELSAVARLTELNARLTEFARGDYALRKLLPDFDEAAAWQGTSGSAHSNALRDATIAAVRKDVPKFKSANRRLNIAIGYPTTPLHMPDVRYGVARRLRYLRHMDK